MKGVRPEPGAPEPDGDLVLRVEGVSKKFCRDLHTSLRYGVYDLTGEFAGRRGGAPRLRPGEFWALRDVSLELRRGEAVGLIGPNGAGKTTLLRLVSGLIKPDAGTIAVRGTVAPLIMLGVGFNPVLTGRENVYVNMAILGLTREAIDERFDEVVAFADIGDALDAPVKTYSSGMLARLGFACAVLTDPDVLLIDEVLSVGDSRFRQKCHRRLGALRNRGTAFVLVSHHATTVVGVCDSAVHLDQGRVVASGPAATVVSRYEEGLLTGHGDSPGLGELVLPVQPNESGLQVAGIGLADAHGQPVPSLTTGAPGSVWIRTRTERTFKDVELRVVVRELSDDHGVVLSLRSVDDADPFELGPGEPVIRLTLPHCGLRPGLYVMKITVMEGTAFHVLDQVETFLFRVSEGGSGWQGLYFQPRAWSVADGGRDGRDERVTETPDRSNRFGSEEGGCS